MKISIYILSFLLIFTISFDTFCQENNTCQEDDYIALRALYLSTDGDNWTDNTGWLTASEFEVNPTIPAGTDVSTWYGIFTNTDSCVICVDLDGEAFYCNPTVELDGNNLRGNLPSEMKLLTQLTKLHLSANQLTGSIPTTIGSLIDLEELNVGSNQFSGNVPSEIGNLGSLIDLKLYNNNFSGNIPLGIGNLSNLWWLDLSGNQLSGTIPSEIGNLSDLRVLNLYSNQLSGVIPPEIGNLINLEFWVSYNNQLSGSLPPEMSNLSELLYLILSDNQLSGCYDNNLNNLCNQLAVGDISGGNNFDATWEDFCATGAGTCVVDTDNIHQNIFKVYPVPATDFVVFDVPNIAAADELVLYDITGKQISRQAFSQDKRLTVSHLNGGVYIYRIFYVDKIYSGKIVVE